MVDVRSGSERSSERGALARVVAHLGIDDENAVK
jgi:hypothetical protein